MSDAFAKLWVDRLQPLFKGGGNPNHDEQGRFASGDGGGEAVSDRSRDEKRKAMDERPVGDVRAMARARFDQQAANMREGKGAYKAPAEERAKAVATYVAATGDGGQDTGDPKRTKTDAQDESHMRRLNETLGRSRYSGVERDLEQHGRIVLDNTLDKDTKESRAVLTEMKGRGWRVEGDDKGATVEPPWSKLPDNSGRPKAPAEERAKAVTTYVARSKKL